MLDELLWQQRSLGLQELLFFVHLMKKSTSYQTLPGSSGSLRLERHPHINKECLLADVVPPSRSGFLMVYREVEPPPPLLCSSRRWSRGCPNRPPLMVQLLVQNLLEPQIHSVCCGAKVPGAVPVVEQGDGLSEQAWPGAPSVR